MSTLVMTDDFGELPRSLWSYLRKHNVSPADYDQLAGKFGRNWTSIKVYVGEHSENGMYRAPWPFG